MTTKPKPHERGFRIVEFQNRTGSVSYRVTGWLRGKRIRENHGSLKAAEARKLELEGERLGNQTAEVLRATWLTPEQLKAAEWAAYRLPEPVEVRRAVEWWMRHGKAAHAATEHATGVSLDDAVVKFEAYLEGAVNLREATRRNLKYRAKMFASEVGNLPLADVTPEKIETWLDGRKAAPASLRGNGAKVGKPRPVSAVTKDNDRRALGRFFQWCVERPQRFIVSNPCREVRVAKPETGEPEVYTLREVCRLLAAARRFREGKFLKFVALQLFGGLRPTEALRFRDDQLVGGHLRIEARQTKTGRGRTIVAHPVLVAWLKVAGKGAVSDPQKSKLLWQRLKGLARLGRWIPDGLRHTAISHHFRQGGSYGLTAEWAGNSEAVIRAHYQARTTPEDSARFWALFPDRKARRAALTATPAAVVAFPKAAAA